MKQIRTRPSRIAGGLCHGSQCASSDMTVVDEIEIQRVNEIVDNIVLKRSPAYKGAKVAVVVGITIFSEDRFVHDNNRDQSLRSSGSGSNILITWSSFFVHFLRRIRLTPTENFDAF